MNKTGDQVSSSDFRYFSLLSTSINRSFA